jgi:hypothetical protein
MLGLGLFGPILLIRVSCGSFAERERLVERRQVDDNQSDVYQPTQPILSCLSNCLP